MHIYLAARYSRIAELNRYAAILREFGYTITSRWLEGSHQISDDGLSAEADRETRERFAKEDLHDLKRADLVISFTEPPRSSNSRGGRHVEFGFALGTGKQLIVIGPRENVFHCLPECHIFKDFDEMMESQILYSLEDYE